MTGIDHEVSLDQPPAPITTPPRVWLTGVGCLTVGALVTAGLMAARPARPTPAPPPAGTVTVRFEPEGGRVDYAAVWDASAGPGQVSWRDPVSVTAPWTAVLTVRADPGGWAVCRVYVGDEVAVERAAADGSSATCVATRR